VAERSRPRWGCHRLDSEWAQRLVVDARLSSGDLVLDVGAGTGAITRELVGIGARVVAVELHGARASRLRERFAAEDVVIVQADACDLRLPRQPFHVVANPPFGAINALLRRLVAPGSRLVRADLVVPRWVARRWMDWELEGAKRWAQHFGVTRGRPIPRHAFHPAPPRDAVVLVITRRHAPGKDWMPPAGGQLTRPATGGRRTRRVR
jgi:23S rRNA (adenine-N6)-dimethyltransferase